MSLNRLIVRLSFLILLACSLSLSAQTLSVESFRMLENDLTANTNGTMEYDQNGEVAALIKVVTLEKGFVFDGGMLGIVKTVQKPGEVWVYVPYGLQRITLAHPEFGVLRDYFFPVSIEKARTYELVLNASRPENGVETDVSVNVNVSFENPMYTSEIFLNGIRLTRGSWKGSIAATTYLIEVKEKGYKTYATTITLGPNDEGKVITLPKLERIVGTVSFTSDPSGASVYVDGAYVGVTPMSKNGILEGDHDVDFRLKGHSSYSSSFSITDEKVFEKVDAVLSENEYLARNNFYAGVAQQVVGTKGLNAVAGLYLFNINLEAGYQIPKVSPMDVYWVTAPKAWTGTSTVTKLSYYPTRIIKGSLGYGMGMGKYLRLTPQAGFSLYTIKGENKSKPKEEEQLTYVISGRIDAKLEYSFVRHIAITVAPSYEIPIKMGDTATLLKEKTDCISNWCKGFSVKAGLEFYF